MNYGSGGNTLVTEGALGICLHLVETLLAECAMVARLSQHTARDLLAPGAQLGEPLLDTLWREKG